MLRPATADDWRAMLGMEAPAHWIGLACEEGDRLLGIGGAYEGQDGRWWASIAVREKRPLSLMKAAREILETADSARVPLHAIPDSRIEGAEKFLVRIGFKATGETIEGREVYRWTP